jgi:hypothetical protein
MIEPDGEKYLTVADLRTLLDELHPTDRLSPNLVRNLRIVRNGESVGFVDFAAETGAVELWEEASR